jgi:hypothetical protein
MRKYNADVCNDSQVLTTLPNFRLPTILFRCLCSDDSEVKFIMIRGIFFYLKFIKVEMRCEFVARRVT